MSNNEITKCIYYYKHIEPINDIGDEYTTSLENINPPSWILIFKKGSTNQWYLTDFYSNDSFNIGESLDSLINNLAIQDNSGELLFGSNIENDLFPEKTNSGDSIWSIKFKKLNDEWKLVGIQTNDNINIVNINSTTLLGNTININAIARNIYSILNNYKGEYHFTLYLYLLSKIGEEILFEVMEELIFIIYAYNPDFINKITNTYRTPIIVPLISIYYRDNFSLRQLIIFLYKRNDRSSLRKYLSHYREDVNSSIEELNKIKKKLEEEKIKLEDTKGNLNREKFIQVVKNKVQTINPGKGIRKVGNKVIGDIREKKLKTYDEQKDKLASQVLEYKTDADHTRSVIAVLTGDQYEEPGGSLEFDNLSSPSSPSPQLHSPPVPDILNNSIFFSNSKPEDDVMDDISFNNYLNNIISLVIDFGENINSDEEDRLYYSTVCPEKKPQHNGLYYTLIRQVTPNPYNINILNQNTSNKIVSQAGGSNNTYTSKNKNHLKKIFKRNLNRVTRKKISNHVKPFFF